MSKHELWELQSMQAAPLSVKIALTRDRIKEWIKTYGEEGVYISFSGGKDSTVLLHLVRELYPDIPAVFCDVPTQYPELKEFATSFNNVVVVKPRIGFAQVCEKYGFPLISKEVSETVEGARKYLTRIIEQESLGNERTNERTNARQISLGKIVRVWEICGTNWVRQRGTRNQTDKHGNVGMRLWKGYRQPARPDHDGTTPGKREGDG